MYIKIIGLTRFSSANFNVSFYEQKTALFRSAISELHPLSGFVVKVAQCFNSDTMAANGFIRLGVLLEGSPYKANS